MIKPLLAILLGGALSGLLPGSSLALNQQSPPPGPQLLREAQAAMKRAGSYHLHATVFVNEAGILDETLTLDGDLSTRPVKVRETTIGRVNRFSGQKSTTSGATEVDVLLVGKHAATRTNRGAWKCTTFNTLQSITGQFVNLSSLATRGATNQGAGASGGVPVWRVRAVTGISTVAGRLSGPAVYEIGQRDHRIYGSDFRVHASLEGMTLDERVRGTYSGFGESVQVTLPPACGR